MTNRHDRVTPAAGSQRMRVLALVPPIEKHVGHWACSSPSIDLVRVIMEGQDLEERVLTAVHEHRPQVLAIIGKEASAYLDLLDRLAAKAPQLPQVPRVYRCQNTAFAHRLGDGAGPPDRRRLAELSGWFDRACDPRWSLVLVQTLDDVPIIREALAPARVAACPYGYDTAVFDPHAPELERVTDVGCYFSLRGDPHRHALVEAAARICGRRGWSFRFVEGRYWHDYAQQIRTTRVCLHRSIYQEVPFRLYETLALGAVLVTDPLRYSVDRLFSLGTEYLTFRPDLSDLEHVLEQVLCDPVRWETIRTAGRQRAMTYTWPRIAERYVAPALRNLLDDCQGDDPRINYKPGQMAE